MIFKIKTRLNFTVLFLSLLTIQTSVLADDLFMIRSAQPFPEAMSSLQAAIKNTGNTLSRVQRIDVGLTKMGYKTDKYRVVFFGKAEEIKKISKQLPELVPYLPLKISIFAEHCKTILVTLDPMSFDKMYTNS